MQLTQQISVALAAAIEAAQKADRLPQFEIPTVPVERPRDTTHGDFASPVAMQLARPARMAPRKIAEQIVAHFAAPTFISETTLAGPGFMNFRLSVQFVANIVNDIIDNADSFGSVTIGRGKRAQVECVSANPTGPITIGRTRGGVIGDTLARLMRAAGYQVELEYYYNDAGRQIQMLGEAAKIRYLQALGQNVELSEDHYKGDYLTNIGKELAQEYGAAKVDAPSDWFGDHAKAIISVQQKETLARINIHHDVYFNEAELYRDGSLTSTLETLHQNGYLYQKEDGSQWLRTTAFGDDKDRVAIRSSDGLPTYRVPDIAYHKNKAVRGFDVVVDIFGPDHHAVAPQVLMGVQMLGFDTKFVHTLLHQVVTLLRDGEQVKMSTRGGVYVTLDELVDEVGPDPVRYFMISRSANSHVNFDLDIALERSDKNPVFYIQNAHVRCAGIFRKWEEQGNDPNADANADLRLLTHPLEQAFLLKALELSDVITLSVENFEPHHIAFYAYELAAAFHPMYDAARVIGDGVTDDLAHARLRLYRAAQLLFAHVLDLMGMSAPDRM
jgi:arginyl-tRNA synthetase